MGPFDLNNPEVPTGGKVGKAPKTPEQLAKQQRGMNQAMAVAGGVTSLLSSGLGMIQEGKSINTAAPQQQVDSFGRPMYNLGNFQSQVSAIKPQGASGGELLSSAMQGASAGAAFGPWGAGIGAVVGLTSAALFGKRRKTLQQRRKSLAQQNLLNAQRSYNQGVISFNSQQAAQSLYEQQQQEAENRQFNIAQALA